MSRSQRWDPRNPAPPVTRTRVCVKSFIAHSFSCGGRPISRCSLPPRICSGLRAHPPGFPASAVPEVIPATFDETAVGIAEDLCGETHRVLPALTWREQVLLAFEVCDGCSDGGRLLALEEQSRRAWMIQAANGL